MPFQLHSTRVHYQSSKYAAVAVIQIEITVPTGTSSELFGARIKIDIDPQNADSLNGPLSISVEGTPIESYCSLVLELQRYAGHSVQYYQAQTSDTDSAYQVFIGYQDAATALYAGELATDLLNTLISDPDNRDTVALQRSLDEFVVFAQARRTDPNTQLLIQTANRLGIPVLKPDRLWGVPTLPQVIRKSGVIQFGWGNRLRRCEGSMQIGMVSREKLAQVLDRTRMLQQLNNASIPIAGQSLESINRNSVNWVQRSARHIGYPVTLRPATTVAAQYRFVDNYVFGPLNGDAEVALAADHLRARTSTDIRVESFMEGEDYRFLIINGEVLSVVRCTPPCLTGDGAHNIAELAIHQTANTLDVDARRAWRAIAQGDSDVIFRLRIAGMDLDSVLTSGAQIQLRNFGTLYNGGSCTDVTNETPAQLRELALRVSDITGLERLVSVEMKLQDLSGPASMPNCAIIGVDPAPDLQEHGLSSEKDPYKVGEKYMAQLFPAALSPRVKTAAVTGTNGKTTTCRMINRILRVSGLKTGLACSDGIYLEDKLLLSGDMSGLLGANALLMNPQTEAAVLETARGGMATQGISFDRCDVGACLNVAEDHLGLEGIHTLDEMAAHKRQVIERTTGVAVLNAEDPYCLAMREYTPANEVILVAYNADHPAIKAHCQAGGRAIVTHANQGISSISIISSAGAPEPLVAIADIPATMKGAARHNVYNAMFAAGLSLGLGIGHKHIISGLRGLEMNFDTTPGRLNEINGFPYRILIDAAHNPHGFNALVQMTQKLPIEGKKIIVFGARGSLQNSMITRLAAIAAGHFDRYVLRNYQQHELRGRAYAEVPEILEQALLHHGVPKHHIIVEPDVIASIDQGMGLARKGDIVIILVRAGGNDKWDTINGLKEIALKQHSTKNRHQLDHT